ncbi:hypothetical protein Bca101_068552 [Brassica carinata]
MDMDRCLKRGNKSYLFKWVYEAIIDEIRMVDAKHKVLADDVKDLTKTMMENFEINMLR